MPTPAEIITVTFGGDTFRCSRRTYAHLLWTQERLSRPHPGAYIVVIQPPFNTGVAASQGTHDEDAVLDVRIVGLSWWDAQRFLRECGWACWYRFPPAFTEHLHMISLGYPGKVGIYIDGGLSTTGRVFTSSQVADYYAHALGLKGQHDSGDDPSWHPADIDSTIFDYDAWEANMPLSDDDLAKIKAIVRAEIAAELDAAVETKKGKRSLRQMVREVFQRG